ncbi:MAG: ribonuclease P protein component [Ferrovibrionaceae bacterium]
MTADLGRLKRRAEYLRVAGTKVKAVMPGVILQAAPAQDADAAMAESPRSSLRLGFTCSRKVGNAVARNRARRRLKALAAEIFPAHAARGRDYVLIGREATVARDFASLRRDVEGGLKRLGLWRG